MKIRNGFVSNSSSSSFILTRDSETKEITIDELVQKVNEGINPWDILIISSASLCEGIEAFTLTEDMVYLIKNYTERFLTNGCKIIEKIIYKPYSFLGDNRPWTDNSYGTEKGLKENEEVIWVDYSSIGMSDWNDGSKQFFERYFLSADEWNALDELNWDMDYAPHKSNTIVYTECKKFSECTDEDLIQQHITIGMNEDICSLDSCGIMVYHKLKTEERNTLIEHRNEVRDGVYVYKDFDLVKKNGTFRAMKERSYYIVQVRGIVEKSKDIEIFMKGERNEERSDE